MYVCECVCVYVCVCVCVYVCECVCVCMYFLQVALYAEYVYVYKLPV